MRQFRLDTASGALLPAAVAAVRLPPESGPRGIVFHPRLRVAYVNCELSGALAVCSVDAERGLTPVQSVSAYPDGYAGGGGLGKASFWAAEAAITRDGRHVYCICRVHQSLAIFAADERTGELRAAGRQPLHEASNARNLTLDPSGRHLLVASQDANLVEVFRVGPDGGLTRTDAQHAPCVADVAVV